MSAQQDVAIAILLPAFLFFIILYFNAAKFYEFHYKLKKNHPAWFNLIGINEKYLYDKNKWIKHMRIYMALIFLAVIVTFLPLIFLSLSY